MSDTKEINKNKFSFTTRAYYVPEEITESEVKYARFTIYPKSRESMLVLDQAKKLIERYEDSNYHYEEIFYFLEEASVEFAVSVENKMRTRYTNKIEHLQDFGITEEDIYELEKWCRFLEKIIPEDHSYYHNNIFQVSYELGTFMEDDFWRSNIYEYMRIYRFLCEAEEHIKKVDILAKAEYDTPTYIRQHKLKKNHNLAR